MLAAAAGPDGESISEVVVAAGLRLGLRLGGREFEVFLIP